MSMSRKAKQLRCALCRRGLLKQYDVYDVPTDEFGAWGEPVLYSGVTGYLFARNTRGAVGSVEIAGELAGGTDGARRMIAFDPACKRLDLVEADGVFYRITDMRVLFSIGCVLDLEVFSYENQAGHQ